MKMQSGVKSSLVWLFILSTSLKHRLNRAGPEKAIKSTKQVLVCFARSRLINGRFSTNSNSKALGNKINDTKILKDG